MSDANEIHRDAEVTMNIGAVSRATGIPTNTLRTWERRYGFPAPMRSDSGQRLYRTADVARLSLIARALNAGHRPRQVVGLPIEKLRSLVVDLPSRAPMSRDEVTSQWLEMTRRLDGEGLESSFRAEVSRSGLLPFLTSRIAPFLEALGEAWAEGEVQVFHEHYASERLREFLAGQWRPLSRANANGLSVVCATLPGEQHFLGLHMAAAVLAQRGCHVVFLGANTPLEDIQGAVEQSRAVAALVSVSVLADEDETRDFLSSLRELLDDGVTLGVGGRGAPEGVEGVTNLPELEDVQRWLDERSTSAH